MNYLLGFAGLLGGLVIIVGMFMLVSMLKSDESPFTGRRYPRWMVYGNVFVVFGSLGILILLMFSSSDSGTFYNRHEVAYLGYRAMDDGEFDEMELEAFRMYGKRKDIDVENVLGKMSDGSATDADRLAYESWVNGMITDSDNTEKKLLFKKYVVEREQDVLAGIWRDKKLDARERELVEYLGEYLIRDGTDRLIEQLEAGNFKDSVDELNVMFEKLSNTSGRFTLGETPMDEQGNLFYEVD